MKSTLGAGMIARISAALIGAGHSFVPNLPRRGAARRPSKWGEIPPAMNRPNKKEKIHRAHQLKARNHLNAKRKRKKIAKRARK